MALKVLTPFALGYFLTYLLRAVNAVVAPDLVSELGLDAAELGLLTAAYLGAFAIFQLPLGVLLDRYGPRRVQAALVAVAGAGCVLFAIGSNGLTLTVARAMIGMGFAGGLMSGFKAVVLWVPEPRRALANAFVMSFGALGLLTATAPDRARRAGDRVAHGVPCARGDHVRRRADHPHRRPRARERAVDGDARPAGAPAARHLPRQGVPGARPAAGGDGGHPHRHPDAVGGPVVPRCGGPRPRSASPTICS